MIQTTLNEYFLGQARGKRGKRIAALGFGEPVKITFGAGRLSDAELAMNEIRTIPPQVSPWASPGARA